MRLSPADNVVIYSSLSIKNIIPNQKPIIPQAPPTTRHFVPPSLPLFRSSLLIWHCSHTIKVPGMLTGGVAGRWRHSDIVMVKVNIIFFLLLFLPVVRWFLLQFCWHRANPWNNVLPIVHMCVYVCVSNVNACGCLCVGCGRWRWQIIAAISMTLPSLFVVFEFWCGMKGRAMKGVSV